MGTAAVAAAKAAGYVNAGTVEFLLDRSGEFYFLEVNTRLQVEHPITEMTVGMDLVRRQIEIASGTPLPFSQAEISRRGHAIECRIYAEDPENSFMPSPGKVLLCQSPEGPGVRYDQGVYTGFEVPVHYDPILSKLVVWAEDRPSACARMIRALKECVILGVKTPIEFLLDVVSSNAFQAGDLHTCFIEEHFPEWKPDQAANDAAAIAFVVHDQMAPSVVAPVQGSGHEVDWASPWQRLGQWDMAR
jgi:acetyl/propionyl-CoA carboxylase alpha subunit